MNITTKLKEFEESILEEAEKKYKKMEQDIENEIKAGIEEEIIEYENKKRVNYTKNVQKLEKDFNKKIFNYELKCKRDFIDEEKKLKKSIEKDVIEVLKQFTNEKEYESFLEKCINEGIYHIESNESTVIGMIKKDIERYGKKVEERMSIVIKELPEKYIGGCTIENKNEGIFIDNTLLNSINERLEG